MLTKPHESDRMNQPALSATLPGLGLAQDIDAGVPVLAGPAESACHFIPTSARGLWKLGTWRGLVAGCLRVDPRSNLPGLIEQAYGELFDILRPDYRLYRVWHYLPGINKVKDGLETYRAFCIARHNAFSREFGAAATSEMPSASAVGAFGSHVSLAFVGGPAPCSHLESPLQIPAYQYPAIHSPKPPSFARATRLPGFLFVSGTSSIRGHETVHPGDPSKQIQTTIENLAVILGAAGASFSDIDSQSAFVTVFLRSADLLPLAREALNRNLPNSLERTQFLLADICRAELDVEIEATLAG